MVKNTTGGNKAKGFARKSQSSGSSNERLRLPTCELEQFACVTKMFGNGMCEIFLNNETRLIGHIRNKFSGGRKRNNLITAFTIVMVGLRDWETVAKNCDILCIFDDNEVEQLKILPQIDIRRLIQMKFSQETSGKLSSSCTGDNVTFTHDVDNDYDMPASAQQSGQKFIIETIDEVDIDDI